MEDRFEELSQYLTDHLWVRSSLDYDFLKSFPEFIYKGTGYRAVFSEKIPKLRPFLHQSFYKTIEGVKEFISNTETYDKDSVSGKIPFIYQCEIEGFDLSLALMYFKKHGGMEAKTIAAFIDEEEVISFYHSEPVLIEA